MDDEGKNHCSNLEWSYKYKNQLKNNNIIGLIQH